MDSRIAILGANGTGKSTLLNLITSVLQPREGTISKHVNLKLAKYSQHSADQLPYDKTPIEYFESKYKEKYPEKDIMVSFNAQILLRNAHSINLCSPLVLACATRSLWFVWLSPDITHQPSIRWSTQPVRISRHVIIFISNLISSVVFSQLAMEHPHVLLLGRSLSLHNIYMTLTCYFRKLACPIYYNCLFNR